MSAADRSLFKFPRLRWWWTVSGLAGAASAGRAELDRRDKNALIFDSPKYGVTVIVARGKRARQLHAAWRRVFREADV